MDILKELHHIKQRFLLPIKVDTDVVIDELTILLDNMEDMSIDFIEMFLIDIIDADNDTYFDNKSIIEIARIFQYVNDYNNKYYYIDNYGYLNNINNEYLLRIIHEIELYI